LDRAQSIGYRAAFIENFAATSSGFGESEGYTLRNDTGSSGFFTGKLSGLVRQKLSRLMGIGKTLIRQTGLAGSKVQNATSRQSTNGKSSLVFGITSDRTTVISPPVNWLNSSCIALSGQQRMAQFPMGGMSITSTATSLTTALKTSWQWRRLSISPCTQKPALGLAASKTRGNLPLLAKWLKLGTLQKKADLGTAITPRKHGNLGHDTRDCVNSAAANMKRHGQTEQNTARKVASVSRIRGKFPVYDLTVRHHHCYFANGVLVSNSDAWGLMCICYEPPRILKSESRDYRSDPKDRGASTSWMVA
jgi:hypothetical protein